MKDNGRTSLGALIALKLVCCGGLLLATGAISAGSLLALVNHPAAKTAALIVIALGAWWGLRKWRARPATGRAATDTACSDDQGRNAAGTTTAPHALMFTNAKLSGVNRHAQ